MGLAIVQQIVVEHRGGAITVESVPQQGTKFTLHLPLKDNDSRSKLHSETTLKPQIKA